MSTEQAAIRALGMNRRQRTSALAWARYEQEIRECSAMYGVEPDRLREVAARLPCSFQFLIVLLSEGFKLEAIASDFQAVEIAYLMGLRPR